MNVAQWEQLVASITYKPNFRLHVLHYAIVPTLLVRMEVPDAEGLERGLIAVQVAEIIPKYIDTAKDAVDFVRHTIMRAEMHEVDEWLRVGGVHVREPHPENARTAA